MNIYVWGTGCGAGELIDAALDIEKVTAFVDSFPVSAGFMGRPVISPQALAKAEYDLVIVTSARSGEILSQAESLGLDTDKLYFIKNGFLLRDINPKNSLAESVLGGEYTKTLEGSCTVMRYPAWLASACKGNDADGDPVRLCSLQAAAQRLAGVKGAAAELGVYKGAFARRINALMPDRTLYLFDTFEGFDEAEVRRERTEGGFGEGFVQAHKNTVAKRVLESMPFPESVRLMPGLFPASLRGLEERFAFVSLDADLRDSIYAGLEYFVPRLNEGGYIFLHDYNSQKLLGVRAAVQQYEEDTGKRLKAAALCDTGGTLVICG